VELGIKFANLKDLAVALGISDITLRKKWAELGLPPRKSFAWQKLKMQRHVAAVEAAEAAARAGPPGQALARDLIRLFQEQPQKVLQRILELERHLAETEQKLNELQRFSDDGLLLMLTEACDLCGTRFEPGQEFYLLTRARLEVHDGLSWALPLKSEVFCVAQCGGVEVVQL